MERIICPVRREVACISTCPRFGQNRKVQEGYRSLTNLSPEIIEKQITAALDRAAADIKTTSGLVEDQIAFAQRHGLPTPPTATLACFREDTSQQS